MNLKKIIKNNKGVTLVELLVSLSLFTVLVLSSMGIFMMVVEGQRSAIATQELQNNLRYIFEVISKEVRMARGDHDGINCGITPYYKTYNTNLTGTDSSNLYFMNKDGECVAYELWADNRIYMKRGGSPYVPVTPSSLEVGSLLFHVEEDRAGTFHSSQGSVRMMMDIKVLGKKLHEQPIKLQTTITSRYYE